MGMGEAQVHGWTLLLVVESSTITSELFMMRLISLAFVCLAFVGHGHGRRVLSSVEGVRSSAYDPAVDARSRSRQALGSMLLMLKSAAAFTPSGLGAGRVNPSLLSQSRPATARSALSNISPVFNRRQHSVVRMEEEATLDQQLKDGTITQEEYDTLSSAVKAEDKKEAPEVWIEFLENTPEACVPDVALTRAPDGSIGTATFRFADPEFMALNEERQEELTGMRLVDEEGVMKTVEVTASYNEGELQGVTAILNLRGEDEWDRFMRFMGRYAEANGLGFAGK
mmetsp:Transcript_56672/g.104033  ORF Transcript_56672/g.104033 Transcript_56672/m.104033 type:complete len:283 (-) Transcript_56672:245-1093(-)